MVFGIIAAVYRGEITPAKLIWRGLQIHVWLVGGWTNPYEKYACQIGSFPQVGVNIKNIMKPPPREFNI